jgi:rhodanese-related sulfurtransferase
MNMSKVNYYPQSADKLRRSLTNMLLSTMLLMFLMLSSYAIAKDDTGFPGRKLYPQVTTLSKEQLYEKIVKEDVVIVDVRSAYEFQTLKILNAINIPVSKKSFADKLKKLREKTDKDIVFYCNGRTCFKSYNAVMKAIKYSVKNCFSYDAGVFEWALKYPNEAVLLDQTPVEKDAIISNDELNAHLLSPKEFEQRSLETNSIIYDVRDRLQRRGGSGIFMFRDKFVGLDNVRKLHKIIFKAQQNNSILFFYDAKGKQVRWLQYTLKAQGLSNYYFMKGGAAAYYKMIREEQALE